MCGRAYEPNFLFMWPNARISVMGGEQAAGVLAQVKREQKERAGETWSKEDEAKFKQPTLDKYEKQSPRVLCIGSSLGRRRYRPC